MEGDETEKLYFYPSKVKFFIMFLIVLIGIGIDVFAWVRAAMEGNSLTIGVCAVIALLLIGISILLVYKGIMAPNPYIILTEEVLIISAIARDKTTSIKWRDIRAFKVREYDFRMNIEIELVDKEANFPKTLHVSKHPNSFAGTSRYGIAWGMIKRKDRLRFVDEMDRRAKGFYTLKEQLFPATDENKTKPSERVTGKYLQKAFLYSLILSAFTALLFSAPQGGSMNIVNLISSFILFPFAKVLYDVIGGFKLGDKLERQRGYINRLIYGLIFIFHLLLYFFSIYIGPLSILYLVIRVMYKNRKNNQK